MHKFGVQAPNSLHLNAPMPVALPTPALFPETARLRLSTIGAAEVEFLYHLSTDEASGFRWRFHGLFPDVEEFFHTLRDKALAQFVVFSKLDDEPCGYVMADAADFRHGHCQVGVLMSPGAVSTGLGIEAGLLLIDYVFFTWPFRKVYAPAPAFNFDQLEGGHTSDLFRLEGRITDVYFFDERFWDQIIVSITRSDFEASKLVSRLKKAKMRMKAT